MGRDPFILLEREAPRERLETALAMARGGRGRLVAVQGEAGIGKTSLVLGFCDAHRADARVHVGGCEHLATPEPLGPLRDIARESRGRLSLPSGGQLAAFESLLRLLIHGAGPALLVIEDLHWADDSTLDMLRYLGRRIRTEHVMIAATFRNDEPGSRARLASLWADLPRDSCERIQLDPLSADAVSALARAAGREPAEVFEAAGGNPFHVTEYLESARHGVPASVQDATLARAAVLSPKSRRVLDCASLFPRRIDQAVLRTVADDQDDLGVEECLREGMLTQSGGALAFRHELARRAVHEAMSPLRRRDLHAGALEALRGSRQARSAELAHHAEQAGRVEDLIPYSIAAAEEAAALGAYQEAVAHLTRALSQGNLLTDAQRAELRERQAELGERCGAFDVAMLAIEEAIAARRRAGEVLSLGNALRISARLYWQRGQTPLAEQRAREAMDVMSAQPDTWQFAMAQSSQAQLDMLADRCEAAVSQGLEAMARAERLGRWDIYLHALTNVATARTSLDPDVGLPLLELAIEEARRRGEVDALPRLYCCLTFSMAWDRRHVGLFDRIEEGVRACVARVNGPLEAYLRGVRSTALLDAGRIREAVAEAEEVIHGPYAGETARFPALVTLSRARVRLGEADDGAIDQARMLPAASRDVMRMAPLAVADAEALWLGEDRPDALSRLRTAFSLALRLDSERWMLGDAALWLAILGESPDLPGWALDRLTPAYRHHLRGDWRAAAQHWAELGCPFEQAIALGDGDEEAQREALAIFDQLGAAPAAHRLRRRMRQSGVRQVPSGPRSFRRNDPSGLTPRQSEVLGLLAAGLSNNEIADRLSTSAKTVEHHVGAILAAFEAPSRLRAVQIARERGLV